MHLLAAVRYVELNPVHVGMVRSAEDYLWSSARFHLGLIPSDILVTNRDLLGLVGNWREYLGRNDEKADDRLLKAIRSGRPAGTEQFVTLVETLTGRSLSLGKRGPRSKRLPGN
jgi:putative transposase